MQVPDFARWRGGRRLGRRRREGGGGMWWVFLTILGGRGALRAASLRWRRYAAGAWRAAIGEAVAGGWWWHVVGLPPSGRTWLDLLICIS